MLLRGVAEDAIVRITRSEGLLFNQMGLIGDPQQTPRVKVSNMVYDRDVGLMSA